ncbi:MAG: cupin domain-containing protein [Acidobacteriota bacterium]
MSPSVEKVTAEALVRRLDLVPHPEGGFYRETYRSAAEIPADALTYGSGAAGSGGQGFPGPRVQGTAIYYLLTPDTFSEMHRLRADEVWHHYLGDAVEQLQLDPATGAGRWVVYGKDLAAGQVPQGLAPRSVWQGARLVADGEHGFALLGCTMAPGFDFADYEAGRRHDLATAFPRWKEPIGALTRS